MKNETEDVHTRTKHLYSNSESRFELSSKTVSGIKRKHAQNFPLYPGKGSAFYRSVLDAKRCLYFRTDYVEKSCIVHNSENTHEKYYCFWALLATPSKEVLQLNRPAPLRRILRKLHPLPPLTTFSRS